MGIRFYCPNGHKLNVKEFQAGRKGICPYCGAKTLIPAASTRGSSKGLAPASRPKRRRRGSDARKAGKHDVPPKAVWPVIEPIAPLGLSPAVAAFESVPAGSAPEPADFANLARDLTETFDPYGGAELAPIAPIAPTPSNDALTEAGEVVWYVRPPSGGQFGPANREVMRTWLAEGRITPDCLVWREGWRDWQDASQVFPRIGPNLAAIIAGETSPLSAMPRTHYSKSRHISRQTQVAIVSGLVAAVVVLSLILLWVWFHDPGL